jgi:3-hydroxyisobutyrate dehydrogenase-like beta-hydroxyacid dehydrogenase
MPTTPDAPGTGPVHGFIGLGHQGSPMAERMIAAGLRPWLWARRAEVLDRYRDTEARIASSPAQVGAECDVIGLCLYDAEATDAVLFGADGVVAAARPGTVLAIHATVPPAYLSELAERVADRALRVVDAPVSGGDEAALNGQLVVIAGGDADAIEACAPMFATYSETVVPVGPLGAAQAAKLVNNALMTAITGLVFDAFALGEAFGIDEQGLGRVLGSGSAANPSVHHYLALGGAETFSIRAWPTLHKDVPLARAASLAIGRAPGPLIDGAEATVAEMERIRAPWEQARSAGRDLEGQ